MLLINLLGIALVFLIAWWFWFYPKKDGAKVVGESLQVRVADGIYQPSQIEIKAGENLNLVFLREDASPCAEVIQFPELDVSESLTLNKAKTVRLVNLKAGRYAFHCQMQMYKGELIVR